MFWSKDFCTPSSPDLYPLDYNFWAVMKRDSKKHTESSVDSPHTAIIDACNNVYKKHLVYVWNRFTCRIVAVMGAKENHFEWFMLLSRIKRLELDNMLKRVLQFV